MDELEKAEMSAAEKLDALLSGLILQRAQLRRRNAQLEAENQSMREALRTKHSKNHGGINQCANCAALIKAQDGELHGVRMILNSLGDEIHGAAKNLEEARRKRFG